MGNLFGTLDMAAGYAKSRPLVHRQILNRAKRCLTTPCRRAIDVGCGAGLSTLALQDLAGEIVGVEPNESMVRWSSTVAPGAHFVVGIAESLPFTEGSTDLITAAGSLNYVDLAQFFREASRLLRKSGVLLIYDFAAGREFSQTTGLSEWFKSFEDRYPAPAGDARPLNPEVLRSLDCGFRAMEEESFTATLPLSRRAYIDYILTETNVSAAVGNGVAADSVRSWCEETLAAVWPRSSETRQDILFSSYFVCMAPIR